MVAVLRCKDLMLQLNNDVRHNTQEGGALLLSASLTRASGTVAATANWVSTLIQCLFTEPESVIKVTKTNKISGTYVENGTPS